MPGFLPIPRALPRVTLGVLVLLGIGCTPQSHPQADVAVAQVRLGEKLFFDSRLSSDGRVSCASCHDPKHAFTDARKVSIGAEGRAGTRNAPSLLDITGLQTFFWDGRENNLRQVVLQPFVNPVEMGLPTQDALGLRLQAIPAYPPAFAAAFDRDQAIRPEEVAAALSAYLNSLSRGQNRFDEYLRSKGKAGLSDPEKQGLALFVGKAACAECHRLTGERPTLTDQRFHHTGVGFEKVAGNIGTMLSRLDGFKHQGRDLGHAILSNSDVAELGRFTVTRQPKDLGVFRTPSLRNVALTAPYMHDGSVVTLSDAIEREIYYRGLARGRPLNLTVEERQHLLAFLVSLTEQ